MNVKEAVTAAKNYIRDVFASEDIEELGLEEIEFDSDANCWRITVGFLRPWDKDRVTKPLSVLGGHAARRTYKLVSINDADGSVTSIKDRRLQMAA